MKRLLTGVALLLTAWIGACFWVLHSTARAGPLEAGVVGRTNVTAAVGYSILGITNRSARDVAFKVEVQGRRPQGWGNILFNMKGPNSVSSGWVAGYSNTLIQVASPEKDARFCLTYQLVPTQLQNYASWTLVPLRIRSPLLSRSRTIWIYPGGNNLSSNK